MKEAPVPPGAAGPPSAPGRLYRTVTYPLRLGPPAEGWQDTRFGRLALVNVLSAAGDTLVVVALAGSAFVTVPLNAARGRTAIGLLCTLLPFALVAPFTGPAADRIKRGKRFVIFLAALGRAAAAWMMVIWLHSLLLFLAAFVSLVCSRTHAVARSALVPGCLEQHPNLVRANARLSVGAGVSGAVAAGMGGAVYALFGSRPLLQVDVVAFAVTAAVTLFIPRPVEVPPPQAETDRPAAPTGRPGSALHRSSLTMTAVRAMTGFMTALVAFGFRSQGAPVIWYGLAAGAGMVGSLAGASLAPAARRAVRTESWLVALSCLAIAATAAIIVPFDSAEHRLGAVALAASAGICGSVGKTAFDAQVQMNVAEDRRARSFARFEALFQSAWVVMALIPTLVPVPLPVGFAVIAAVLALAGLGLAGYLLRSRHQPALR